MNNKRFPLIEACGLKPTNPSVWPAMYNLNQDMIFAADLERMLERGVKVTGIQEYDQWCFDESSSLVDTHSGIVVALKELKPKSELEEAREIIQSMYSVHIQDKRISSEEWYNLSDKAKQFLERNGKERK